MKKGTAKNPKRSATAKKPNMRAQGKPKGATKPNGKATKELAANDTGKVRGKAAVGVTSAEKNGKEGKGYDPDRCATPRCKGAPSVTHLGKPLCQKCWERVCAKEEGRKDMKGEASGASATTTAKGGAKSKGNAKSKAAKPKVAKAEKEQKPKRMSALDAAALVLKKAGKPMRSKELITRMAEQNLWTSPGGATPWATLHAAICREINKSGNAARFRKAERGQFALNANAKKE